MNTLVYTLDVSPLFGGAWRGQLAALPAARRERALGMARDADAARCVGAGLILQRALEGAGIPPEKQVFGQNKYGKPLLIGENRPHFSLSHSGQWAVCAVSDAPVGVDIDTARCTMRVARRFFSPEEAAYLEFLDGSTQKDALARLWTAKEAYLKAQGTGLAARLSGFTVTLSPDGAAVNKSPWRLWGHRLGDYYLCVCTRDDAVYLV